MKGVFPTIRVSELVASGEVELKTGPFGTQLKANEYVEHGTPVINVRNIGFGTIKPDKLEYISPETRDRLSSHVLRCDDIVFGRKGAVERHVFIRKEQHGWFQGSDCLRLRLNSPRIHPQFASYHFLSEDHQQWMKNQCGHAATMASLNQQILERIELPLPPLPVQRRIAGILSAYDELIENSQQRIRLLEDMARALYREWFVHFRFPGNESVPHLPSALRDIPQGWECVTLGSMIKVTHGCAFQGIHFSEEPTSRVLATPGNFRVGGGIKYDKLKFYSEGGPLESDYIFEPMDLMVTMTDLSKAGDTLGFPAFVPKLEGLTFLHNQRIGRVLPVGEFFPKHYLYCLLCEERYRHHIVGGATGTAVKHTSPTRILSFPFALPKDAKLIHAFENFARPIFRQINNLIEALENLRRTRDLLLPRLLNGQITTIPNASPS